MFFSRRGNRVPLIRGKRGSEVFLRLMGLLAVIAVTCWLFWLNAAKTVENFESKSTVVDMGDALSPEMRSQLNDFSTLFKKQFGVEIKVWIGDENFEIPELDSKTMFFGVHPAQQRVQVVLPPLVGAALGPEFVNNVGQTYFAPAFKRGEWPEGLLSALGDIYHKCSTLSMPKSEEFRSKIAPPQNTASENTQAEPKQAQ